MRNDPFGVYLARESARYKPHVPWSVERNDTVVEVEIASPVHDWENLLDAIDEHLEPDLAVIALPETLPGASFSEVRMFHLLRSTLRKRGLAVQGALG
jgi:hypothetical protein